MRPAGWALVFILLLTLVPFGYLYAISIFKPPVTLTFTVGWEDTTLNTTVWRPSPSFLTLTSQNGTLGLHVIGSLAGGMVASAQRRSGLNVDLQQFHFLRFSVRTPSLWVAARVVLWLNSTDERVVLLKTYNDQNWHTEIIDLRYFYSRLSPPYALELGLLAVQSISGPQTDVYYKDPAFLMVKVGSLTA